MSNIQLIPKERQGKGAFNGGEIVENKPIGFPQDHSSIRPYSNLFYWAHAKAVRDSTIGLHPHQGFEICSFVLKGQIRHYDTKLKEWRPLEAGDVQIIRAGNGISHSEWMGEGSEMFQIWFDPNLQRTLSQPASYDDYRAADFPLKQEGNAEIRTLAGEGSPFKMDTPGISVQRISLKPGQTILPARSGEVYSVYVLSGAVRFGDQEARESDFLLAQEMPELPFQTESGADIFMIASPAVLPYRTYLEMRQMA